MNEEWKRVTLDAMFLENDAVKAAEILLNNSPKSLFRYRSGIVTKRFLGKKRIRDIDSLLTNKVWASSAAKFNDPFDSRYIFDIPESLTGEKRELLINGIKRIIEPYPKKTYIACFSETQYSLPMWSYYANEHRGFCVEYEYDELNELTLPVVYDNKAVEISACDENKLLYCALRKSPEWEHENEWRMVRCEELNKPYKQGVMLDACKPIAIYLGCRADKFLEEQLMEYCRKEQVNLYKMTQSVTSYTLKKTTIIEF